MRPDAQEVNVEHLEVILHENGVEFVPVPVAKPPDQSKQGRIYGLFNKGRTL